MIELKDTVLATELTKAIWRENRSSKEWTDANTLYRFFFGVNLGSSKCECLEDLFQFIKSKNINQKIKNKMSKEFILIKGKVLQTSKFGVITDASSDEKCIKLLTAYPVLSKEFKTLPDNWKEICVEQVKSNPLDGLKVSELKEYIESKGAEIPEGKKAAILEFAKTL